MLKGNETEKELLQNNEGRGEARSCWGKRNRALVIVFIPKRWRKRIEGERRVGR